MHPRHLHLSQSMRESAQGTAIRFGDLAMFQDEAMKQYMSHVLELTAEGLSKGHSPTQLEAEAWLQDNGELMVIIPGFDGSYRTMIVPKGEWRLMSDEQLSRAPKELVSDSPSLIEDVVRSGLEEAMQHVGSLTTAREAYEREHDRGGIVILSKSREGLLALDSFGDQYPFLANTLNKFARDQSKHYLLLFFSNEDRRTSSYAFADLDEVLAKGVQGLARTIGGDMGRVGIGTPLSGSDVVEIMEAWEAIGGGVPFGKNLEPTPGHRT